MGLDAHVLVLGGPRSGKSRFAEELVLRSGLAPGLCRDRHRRRRGDGGAHRVASRRAAASSGGRSRRRCLSPTRSLGQRSTGKAVLVDCLTLWLSNLMEADLDIDAETASLIAVLEAASGPVVIVSNEVGSGIVPDNALARRYSDAQGILNQRVAAAVGRVVLMSRRPAAPAQARDPREHRTMSDRRIPATVVTGFLGAGKTTLIRNLLRNARGRRIALIVNEFGDMGFDGGLLSDCGDDACRPGPDRRADQRLHLLHRRRRVPADDGDAARPRPAARPHRHRDLGPGAAAAAGPGLQLAERSSTG